MISRMHQPRRTAAWAAALACGLLYAGTTHAQIMCTTGDPQRGLGPTVITIRLKPDGRFDASVNQTVTHANGMVADEPIRPDLDWSSYLASDRYQRLNAAERSVILLHRAQQDQRAQLQLPFELARVRRMKTYDLTGQTDKFGGNVLQEAFDAQGALLGRVVRAIPLLTACR